MTPDVTTQAAHSTFAPPWLHSQLDRLLESPRSSVSSSIPDSIDEKTLLVQDELEFPPAWTDGEGERRRQRRGRNWLVLLLVILIIFAVLAAFKAGHERFLTRNAFDINRKLQPLTLEGILNGTYSSRIQHISWLKEAADGVASERADDGSILLIDVAHNTSRTLVAGDAIRNREGARIDWTSFTLCADGSWIIFAADTEKLWRHSTRNNYWLHELSTGESRPLVEHDSVPVTSIAQFAPHGHALAYVHANDLFIRRVDDHSTIQLTSTGNETVLNGVPGWIYEEEVFGSDSAVWWSPDGSKLVYATFDETLVPEYSWPIYNRDPSAPGAQPYTTMRSIRYPKPGYPNPTFTLHAFDLSRYADAPRRPGDTDVGAIELATFELSIEGGFSADDSILNEVAWLSDTELLVRVTNREATHLRVIYFDLSSATLGASARRVTGRVTRDVDYAEIDGGWVEPGQHVRAVLGSLTPNDDRSSYDDLADGYLDVVPDAKGYRHIALFSPADASEPIFLTTGEWEVASDVTIDLDRRRVYFIAANPSIERHLYFVPLPTRATRAGDLTTPTRLTEDAPGFYSARFSPKCGFYWLVRQGPDVARVEIIKVDDTSYSNVLETNEDLSNRLALTRLPEVVRTNVTIDSLSA